MDRCSVDRCSVDRCIIYRCNVRYEFTCVWKDGGVALAGEVSQVVWRVQGAAGGSGEGGAGGEAANSISIERK